MLTRRRFNLTAGAAAGWMLIGRGRVAAAAPPHFPEDLAQFEAKSGGRLGVAVIDTRDGSLTQHRGEERFPMCSTFKVLAAAAILKNAGENLGGLQQRVHFEKSDLVDYSPVTSEHTGGDGMTLAELCEAAVTRSDNTAGNLLLKNIGGPEGLTSFARSLGDQVTRLDRIETELNEAKPGDVRDTTSPNAMAANLQKLALGDALLPSARDQLIAWMIANKTGDARLRAGLPRGWRVGDKTGSGRNGTANDIAVVWPSDRPPLIVTVYLTGSKLEMGGQNEIIARVGGAIGDAFG
jgi:beta-lactamase class A